MLYRQLLHQISCSSKNIEVWHKESLNKGLCLDDATSRPDKHKKYKQKLRYLEYGAIGTLWAERKILDSVYN